MRKNKIHVRAHIHEKHTHIQRKIYTHMCDTWTTTTTTTMTTTTTVSRATDPCNSLEIIVHYSAFFILSPLIFKFMQRETFIYLEM